MLARLGLALMWVLHGLPLAVLARLGELFGLLLHALAAERRAVCRTNLERCLPQMFDGIGREGPHTSREGSAAVDDLVRAHFCFLGRSLLERGNVVRTAEASIDAAQLIIIGDTSMDHRARRVREEHPQTNPGGDHVTLVVGSPGTRNATD